MVTGSGLPDPWQFRITVSPLSASKSWGTVLNEGGAENNYTDYKPSYNIIIKLHCKRHSILIV